MCASVCVCVCKRVCVRACALGVCVCVCRIVLIIALTKSGFFKLPHIFNEGNNKNYLLHGYKDCTCKSAERLSAWIEMKSAEKCG